MPLESTYRNVYLPSPTTFDSSLVKTVRDIGKPGHLKVPVFGIAPASFEITSNELNPLADKPNWNTGGRKQSKGPMDPMMMALYAGAALLVVFLVVKK